MQTYQFTVTEEERPAYRAALEAIDAAGPDATLTITVPGKDGTGKTLTLTPFQAAIVRRVMKMGAEGGCFAIVGVPRGAA